MGMRETPATPPRTLTARDHLSRILSDYQTPQPSKRVKISLILIASPSIFPPHLMPSAIRPTKIPIIVKPSRRNKNTPRSPLSPIFTNSIPFSEPPCRFRARPHRSLARPEPRRYYSCRRPRGDNFSIFFESCCRVISVYDDVRANSYGTTMRNSPLIPSARPPLSGRIGLGSDHRSILDLSDEIGPGTRIGSTDSFELLCFGADPRLEHDDEEESRCSAFYSTPTSRSPSSSS
jgi:hypothetical protein